MSGVRIGVAAAAAMIAMAHAQGNAASISCATPPSNPPGIPDVTGYVTGTSGCEWSQAASNVSEALVNAENFFGFSDWAFSVKDNDVNGVDEGVNTYGLSFTGDTISGTWSLTSFPADKDFMLVFKAGSNNGKTVPGNIVAYFLSAISGTYLSPTLKSSDFSSRDISHISLYVRDNATVIPVPGAIWLMGAGLAGLGLAGRKKKSA